MTGTFNTDQLSVVKFTMIIKAQCLKGVRSTEVAGFANIFFIEFNGFLPVHFSGDLNGKSGF